MVYRMHHHPGTAMQPPWRRMGLVSVLIHAAALVFLTFSLGHKAQLAAPPAIKVQLIGVPQPKQAPKPKEKPEPIRTQDSPAPKEPPKNAKNIPDSKATSKMLKPVSATTPQKRVDVAAAERPPVLDKTPKEKKVVKNKPDAKVVRNPEDFLAQLDFVDELAKQASTTDAPAPTQGPAGEGPKLQIDLADSGLVSAIRDHIGSNWLIPPGLDVRGLSVTVFVRLDGQGNLVRVDVTQSSGQTFFDNSLIRAVQKAMPLPIPADQLSRFQELELSFQAP